MITSTARLLLAVAALSLPAVAGDDTISVPTWIDELRSSDPLAREHAVAALVEHGPDARAALDELLAADPPPLVSLAARRAWSAIVGASPEVARAVDGRLEALVAAEHPDVAGTALWILERGDAALRYALRDGDPDHSRIASVQRHLEALSAVRDLAEGRNAGDGAARRLVAVGEPVLDALAAVASSAAVPDGWRATAAERLVGIGGADALDETFSLVAGDDPVVREIAVATLAATAGPEHFERLVRTAGRHLERERPLDDLLEGFADRLDAADLRDHLGSRHARLLELVATSLGRRRDAEARDGLRRHVDHGDAAVAGSAVLALGRIGDAQDLELLAGRLEDGRPSVRRAALAALASLGGGDALAWMATGLADPEPSVRSVAARCLGDTADEAAVDPLVAALADDDASVLAEATRGLLRLTDATLDTVTALADERERRAAREAWETWLADRHDEARDDDDEDEEPVARAAPHATDGGRILRDVARLLRREFRPYGSIDASRTETAALVAAAVDGMQDLLERETDPDDPEWLTLALGGDGRAVLSHLLDHGRFEDPDELGRLVGALPVGMELRDFVLLTHTAARSMVGSLGDRFTRLTVLENAEGEVDPNIVPALFGRERSLGLMVREGDDHAMIEFVWALGPAHRAGLRPGDRLIAIDGELTGGMDARELTRRLDRPVELLVQRGGWTNPVRFSLEPESADPDRLVTSAVLPGRIGYLRLRGFEPACAQDVEWALRDLEKEGIDALVLDLRGNPGGTVIDAAAIVDKFVPEGETITTMWTNSHRDGEDHDEEVIESTDSETDRDVPMAVLVDRCSASASEMTAGALQDLERATIVGRTSWGKGIGQNAALGVRGFTRHSVLGETTTNLALSVTILEYFLPTGRSIQGSGVDPEVPVRAPLLLGERFELRKRATESGLVREFVAGLAEDDPELATALARFDDWDPSAYPGFDDLEARLDLQLATNLVRDAVRTALRAHLATQGHDFVADVQEDEDLRAAVAELAAAIDLDLEAHPAWRDLAE